MSVLTASGDYQLVDQTQPALIDFHLSYGITTPLPPWSLLNEIEVTFNATIATSDFSISLLDWETNCNHPGCNIDRGFFGHKVFVLPDPAAILHINIWSSDPIDTVSLGYFVLDGAGHMTINTLTAVPEPSTWLMLLIGFVALSAARRRLTVHPAPSL